MAQVLVISVTKELPEAVYPAIVEELDDYYKHLECDCMDVANRLIGDKRFDIWVDDAGLLKEDPIISAVTSRSIEGHIYYEPMLAGNLIIANHDSAGNTTSLSREDVEMILDHILVRPLGDRRIPCLECEY